MSDSTKDLGERNEKRVRLGANAMKVAEHVAKLTQMPVNSVVNLGLVLLGVQFYPDLRDETLTLDGLRREVLASFEEAERLVTTFASKPRKTEK